MAVQVSQLFYAALRLAGVTKFADASQKAPSQDQLGDCLQQAQPMLDQAQVKRPMIYTGNAKSRGCAILRPNRHRPSRRDDRERGPCAGSLKEGVRDVHE